MNKTLIYMIILVSLVLAACAPATATATEPVAGSGGGETSERCGDKSQLADEIFLYTWVEYIDPESKLNLRRSAE